MMIIGVSGTNAPRWQILVSIILLLSCGVQCSEAESGKAEEEIDKADYLYFGDPEAAPVKDYIPSKSDSDTPEFLLPSKGPRIVEFYAPWCPHCQHFRNHFVQLAKQITTIAKENGIDNLEVYSVSCTANKAICQKLEVKVYPKIFLFKAGATEKTGEASYWSAHPFDILQQLDVQVDNLNLAAVEVPKHVGHSKTYAEEEFPRTKQDIYDDAYLSFVFAMKNGVFLSNEALTNKTKDALSDWLNLLKVSMPPAWNIQQLVHDLLEHFDNITQSEEQLVAVLDRHPAPKKSWSSSCVKGNPAMGYTCGLWELFHIATVGVVEWNLLLNSDDNFDMIVEVDDSATTIRDFVENFFGCEVCRLNFVSNFDSCGFDRCNRLLPNALGKDEWLQLPVWLWETHNAVNVRLLREKFEREDLGVPTPQQEATTQFPLRQDCPGCWDKLGGWTDETIYKYLRIEYWPEDAVNQQYRKELFESANSYEDDDNFVMPNMAVQIIPIAVLGGLALGWYGKQMERKRSGYHKKTDEAYYNGNGHGV